MIRLFIALNIPENIKDQLILLRDSVAAGNYKWESKDKLHLTLKFIGDTTEENVEKIIEELKFLKDYSSINCSINDFGFFFRDNNPSILWAGMKVADSLFEIVDKIESILEIFSITKEKRKFHPHLTLLRIKKNPGNNFINSFKNFKFVPINFQANSISLYKSELKSTGSVYQEIKNYKLK
jgi:2'-5' RNA ligase